MVLTITTTFQPATDLGHLLRKHPARVHTGDLGFGRAYVFYPEATAEQCSAMSGKSKERPELVDRPLPLQARISVLPCRGGEAFLHRLFEPLGYAVSATGYRLDEKFQEWGESAYFTLSLEGMLPLRRLLTHLYVLMPVLDNDKHCWVGDDEVEKLLRHGEGWLALHPEREIITTRYLKYRRSLIRDALGRLVGEEDPDPDAVEESHNLEEAATVVLTTPNAEYNVKWENLPAGRFRHKDHRFEWTRSEFQTWANGIAERFGYRVRFLAVGPEDAALGAPTQMGIFERA